jgi:NADH dehydrogenase FAD-containing subunit
MSEIETKTGFDVLVDLNLSKVKSKLKRKIVKQLKKENIKVIVNVDVYGVEEGTIDILTDAVATLKPKKRKKTKKS